MRTSFSAVTLAGCAMIAAQVVGAAESTKDDSWQNLKHVRHDRAYTFVDRERNCIAGETVAVTQHSITLKRWNATGTNSTTVTLDRPNLLRVTDGGQAYDVLYSGRSSWSDVQGTQGIPASEAVLLITKDGRRHRGKLAEVSENYAKLRQWNKTVGIPKNDVAQVYYLRYTPPSASAMYAAQEMFFLDPDLWPYMLGIAPKIPVLLYDSSMPENNDPVECKSNPWRQ